MIVLEAPLTLTTPMVYGPPPTGNEKIDSVIPVPFAALVAKLPAIFVEVEKLYKQKVEATVQ